MTEPQFAAIPQAIEPPPATVWAAVKEAVLGRHRHDYTAGPIGRALMLLAVREERAPAIQ